MDALLLERLTEVDARYAYYGDTSGGSLVVESDDGDTILPPYGGRWTILEEVADREDAVDAATEWAAQTARS